MSMLIHFGYFINIFLESEDNEDVGLVEEATKGKALLVLAGLNDDSYNNTSFPPGELIQLNGRQNGAKICNDSVNYPGPGSLHSATGGLVFGGIPLICGGVSSKVTKDCYTLGDTNPVAEMTTERYGATSVPISNSNLLSQLIVS